MFSLSNATGLQEGRREICVGFALVFVAMGTVGVG